MVSKEYFGNYQESTCKSQKVIKDKNVYLLWHQVKVHETKVPKDLNDYKVIKRMNWYDILVTAGTIGFFSTETVKIKIKDCTDKSEPVPVN